MQPPYSFAKSYYMVTRTIFRSAPMLAVIVAVYVLWTAIQPVVFALAVGALVDSVPNIVAQGFSEALRSSMGLYLIVVLFLFIADVILGAVADPLVQSLAWKVEQDTGKRLLTTALLPETIGHMEDPAIADRFSLARGQINGAAARTAVFMIVRITGLRLAGIIMGILLFRFQWWAPIAIVVSISGLKVWLLRDIRTYELGLQSEVSNLRRAHYFRDLNLVSGPAKEMRIFGLVDWAVQQFLGLGRTALRELWQMRQQNRWIMVGVISLHVGIVGLVASAISSAGVHGNITVGEVTVYLQAMFGMLSLIDAPDAEFQLRRAALAVSQVSQLEEKLSVPGGLSVPGLAPSPAKLGFPKTCIRFEDIHFTYPHGEREILSGFNLDMWVGQSLAIVGPNGAGKTTIIKLLTKLYEPQQGRIYADGHDLTRTEASAWRRHIAVVFQDFCRWELSVRDNLAFNLPKSKESDAILWSALEKAGALQIVRTLPHGLDTVLSRGFRDGTELSEGQWQRLAVARAIVAVKGGARLLVLDEPTSGLDIRAEASFYSMILDLAKEFGLTTVIVSHRFPTIRLADRIVVLDEGQIVEDGSHDDLINRNGMYARMFNLQAQPFLTGDDGSAVS